MIFMEEEHTNKHTNAFDDEIDFRELSYVLFDGKWIIVSVTACVSIIGVIFSLHLPNIYESEALLVPVESSGGIGALGGYDSLAGIAGISLPSNKNGSNSLKAIQKINSLSFFENNILPNINLPDLMAVKSWDSKTNILAFDENIYDVNSNTWIRGYSHPKQQIPSAQESFRVFKSKHLNLTVAKKSGFLTLSIKHQSPFLAKQWVELVVNEVNSFYRQKDKSKSEKAVRYLNQQFSMTALSEIKIILARLLQDETKKLTLIESNEFYVFDYIDPPAVLEVKSEPKRSIIVFISAILGGVLSILLVLIRHYALSKKTS